jgi:predicted RNase H-like HicB family nuclease
MTYEATASQDGNWWIVSVPQLDIVGQSPTRDSVETVAREVIGLFLDADPDSFEVVTTIAA